MKFRIGKHRDHQAVGLGVNVSWDNDDRTPEEVARSSFPNQGSGITVLLNLLFWCVEVEVSW